MQIHIRQTRGIAGTIDFPTVDTAQMGARGKRIEQLVASLHAAAPGANGIGADLPMYEITVVDGGASRIIEKADDGPDQDVVRALVAAVGSLEAPFTD